MLFNSYEFIALFLPLTVVGFFFWGKYGLYRSSLAWLLLASLFYYGWWNFRYLLLIGFSICFNYCIGLLLNRYRYGTHKKNLKCLLLFGVSVNISLIAYYKYANFFIDTASSIFGTTWSIGNFVLPIGISFFTFQQIVYLVDTSRGQTRQHDFLSYCLFVSFFPQLVAGPIVHHKEILPQFTRSDTFKPSLKNISIGGSIFCLGLFKKVMIADQFGLVATPIFTEADLGGKLDFFKSWEGTFAYTFQIYFDFSGYSDMAIGLARLFNIRLPLNFNSPYQASSIIDFWRRWHITLSKLLRDYVYIPLGGSRRGQRLRYINIMLTMLIGGLWHGASWTFVLWGGLHGVLIVLNHLWRGIWRRPLHTHTWWSRLIARSCTFLVISMLWVFFRAETFQGALNIFKGMLVLPAGFAEALGPFSDALAEVGFQFNSAPISSHQLKTVCWFGFWLLFVWFVPNTQDFFSRYRPALGYQSADSRGIFMKRVRLLQWVPNVYYGLLFGVLFAISLLGLSQVTEFLYFQF